MLHKCIEPMFCPYTLLDLECDLTVMSHSKYIPEPAVPFLLSPAGSFTAKTCALI